ncbi:MAG: hypothetical protein JXJ17_12365, partial [Anaerolineae bacterium]|nr:hypothetical protein [Anaerolineae bacterium]
MPHNYIKKLTIWMNTGKKRVVLTIASLLILIPLLFSFGSQVDRVSAAASLSIDQITWSILGLDSNDVDAGPNDFPVGVRVCNAGPDPSGPLTATFSWTTANTYINLINASPTQDFPALASGDCRDIYYSVRITRDVAAYDTTRRWQISVTDGDSTVSTGQQLYVELLISQNRNSTSSITGPTSVLVGNSYTWTVDATTATNGYNEIEHYLTFCPSVYRLDSVTAQYSAPKPFTTDTFWQDGCNWDTANNTNRTTGCSGVKYGGDIIYNYNVTIVGAGACTLRDMVYDFSGSSYHYNTDYPDVTLNITAYEPACIDGQVYKDDTEDDVYDPATADQPIFPFTITAYLDLGTVGTFEAGTDTIAATTTTNADGTYQVCVFSGEPYFIGVDTNDPQVANYILETPTPNPNNLGVLTTDITVDFDFNPNGSISGFLYLDNVTQNDTMDAGEPGISGQLIQLYIDDDGTPGLQIGSDTLVDSTSSAADGSYTFD